MKIIVVLQLGRSTSMVTNDRDRDGGGWGPTLLAWAFAGAILMSTYILVVVPVPLLTTREWVAQLTLVASHLAAAKIIETVMAGPRTK
jgi:hypothetical protein